MNQYWNNSEAVAETSDREVDNLAELAGHFEKLSWADILNACAYLSMAVG